MSTVKERLRVLASAVSIALATNSFADSLISTPLLSAAPTVVKTVSNCSDGKGNGNDMVGPPGSLRELMFEAVEGEEIDVPCSTITLQTGDIGKQLDVGVLDLTIVGTLPTPTVIDAHYESRVIADTVKPYGTGTLTLRNLELKNGTRVANYAGYGTEGGGCIGATTNVTLQNSILTRCSVDAHNSDSVAGGAIRSLGAVKLYGSTISGGGVFTEDGDALGGAVKATGVYLYPSRDSQGNPIAGSGSTISGTRAIATKSGRGLGGAVFAYGVAIKDSTISGCTGTDVGAIYAKDEVTMHNSTVSSNTAIHDNGAGGIFALRAFFSYNSTIAFNIGAGVNVVQDPLNREQPIVLRNSIISNSTKYGTSNPPTPSADLQAVSVATLTGSGNIIEKYQVQNSQLTSTITGVDPLLGPLQNNGGSTLTRMPGTGSATFGAGAPLEKNTPGPDALDQRGVPRPFGRVDIGAVEDTIFVTGMDGPV